MKALLTATCLFAACTIASAAEPSAVDLQKEKVKLLKEDCDELRRAEKPDEKAISAADIRLDNAKVELRALEGDPKTAVKAYKELVIRGQERVTWMSRQLQKGTATAAEFRQANVEFLDYKIALIKAEKVAEMAQ